MRVPRNFKAKARVKPKSKKTRKNITRRKRCVTGNHVSIRDLDSINKALHENKSNQGDERTWKLIPKDSKEVYKLRRKRAQQEKACREEDNIEEEPTEDTRNSNPPLKQPNMKNKLKFTKKKPSTSAGEGLKKKQHPEERDPEERVPKERVPSRCYSECCSSLSSMLTASCHDCDSVTTASTHCSHYTDMEY